MMVPVFSQAWADEKIDALVAIGHSVQDAKQAVADMRRFVPTHLPPLRVAGGPGSGRYPKGSGGQTNTPTFKAWFGESKVVNPDGTPQVLYHGTNSDPSDFHTGTHFGTADAANERADILSDFSTDVVHRDPGRFQLMPVYLSIQNPLRLPDMASLDDLTGDSLEDAQAAFERKYPDADERAEREDNGSDAPMARAWEDNGSGSGLISTLYERDVVSRDEFWDHQYDSNEEVFKLLEEKGYDGIVYENAVENPGLDSWIIFHPEQVKSAIGNSGAFSKATKLITGGGPGSGRYPKGSGGDGAEVFFYHGTTSDAREAIKREGLKPMGGPGADAWRGHAHKPAFDVATPVRDAFGKIIDSKLSYSPQMQVMLDGRKASIYLASKYVGAKSYAEMVQKTHPGSVPLVLRIAIPKEHLDRLMPDEGSVDVVRATRFQGTIRPEWIQVVNRTIDSRLRIVGADDQLSALEANDAAIWYAVIVTDVDNLKSLGGPGSGRYPKGSGEQGKYPAGSGGQKLTPVLQARQRVETAKEYFKKITDRLTHQGKISDGASVSDTLKLADPEYDWAYNEFIESHRDLGTTERAVTLDDVQMQDLERREGDAQTHLMNVGRGVQTVLGPGGGDFRKHADYQVALAKLNDLQRELYDAHLIEKENVTARVEMVERRATGIAVQMGVDPEIIHVVDKPPPVFTVGERQFSEAGHFDPGSGQIEINARSGVAGKQRGITANSAEGIAAHEISHAIYETIKKERVREYGEIAGLSVAERLRLFEEPEPNLRGHPRPEALAELRERFPATAMWGEFRGQGVLKTDDTLSDRMDDEDGHSNYAKAYWTKEALSQLGSGHRSENETLAEVTRYIVSPQSWVDGDTPEPKSSWVKLSTAMRSMYATLQARRRARSAYKPPDAQGRKYGEPGYKTAGGPGSGRYPKGSGGQPTDDAPVDDELITGRLTDDLDNVSGSEHTQADIQKVLDHYKATPLKVRQEPVPGVFVTDTHVIEWGENDEWPSYAEKADWINNADLDTYFPGYEDQLNTDFWSSGGEVYHATPDENAEDILRDGIEARNQTKGLTNRHSGSAVYTTTDVEETELGSYGDTVFAIDVGAMAKDGYKPYTSQEPDIVESELRRTLAHVLGVDDYEYDEEHGMSPSTIAIHGHIPAKYVKRMAEGHRAAGGPGSGRYKKGSGGNETPQSPWNDGDTLSSSDPAENQQAAARLLSEHPDVLEAVQEYARGRKIFGLDRALSSPENAGKFFAEKIYGAWNYKQMTPASSVIWMLEDVASGERTTPLARVVGSLLDKMRDESIASLGDQTSVRAYRGVVGTYDPKKHTGLESWSTSKAIAKSFARDAMSGESKTLLTADIPVKHLWGLAPIGFANAKESEVLVNGLELAGVQHERI